MDKQTAKRYNQFYDAARPITIVADGLNINIYGNTDAADAIYPQVLDAVRAALPEAQAAELRDAAKEGRRADVCEGIEGLRMYGAQFETRVHARAVRIAMPQIEMIVQASNRARKAAYETYRIACEQGVAVVV